VPGFDVPPGIDPAALNGWNSFPSDHACVYFALTTVIWRRSQLLGTFRSVACSDRQPAEDLFGAPLPE
jgi:hypothetical protein